MISFAEHQKNIDYFYSLGTPVFEIFKANGALNLWRGQTYFLEDVSGDNKTEQVSFVYECFSQGDTDRVTINLSYTLVDNFNESSVVAAAIAQRAANEAEKLTKAAKEAEAAAIKERTELATMFVQRAKTSNAENIGQAALQLASSLGDELLNERIRVLADQS